MIEGKPISSAYTICIIMLSQLYCLGIWSWHAQGKLRYDAALSYVNMLYGDNLDFAPRAFGNTSKSLNNIIQMPTFVSKPNPRSAQSFHTT